LIIPFFEKITKIKVLLSNKLDELWENIDSCIKKIEILNIPLIEEKLNSSYLIKIQKNVDKIRNEIKKNKIDIAVLGQVKYGKSTFINSLVFGEEILPTSGVPENAVITRIEYSEEKNRTADIIFFNRREWADINKSISLADKKDANLTDDTLRYTNNMQEKLKSIEASNLDINDFVKDENYVKQVDVSKISDYISVYNGKKGFYTVFVKEAVIYSDSKLLKCCNIIDTPGTNDPNIEREKRTKEYLIKIDAVILLLTLTKILNDKDIELIENDIGGSKIDKTLPLANHICLVNDPVGNILKHASSVIESRLNSSDKDSFKKVIYQTIKNIGIIEVDGLLAMLGRNWKECKDKPNYKKFITKLRIKNKEEAYQLSNLKEVIEKIETHILKNKNIFNRLFVDPFNSLMKIHSVFKNDLNIIESGLVFRLENIKKDIGTMNSLISIYEKISNKFGELESLTENYTESIKEEFKNSIDDFIRIIDKEYISKFNNILNDLDKMYFLNKSRIYEKVNIFTYEINKFFSDSGYFYEHIKKTYSRHFDQTNEDGGADSCYYKYCISKLLKDFLNKTSQVDVKLLGEIIANNDYYIKNNALESLKISHKKLICEVFKPETDLWLGYINNKNNMTLLSNQLNIYKDSLFDEIKKFLNSYLKDEIFYLIEKNIKNIMAGAIYNLNHELNILRDITAKNIEKNVGTELLNENVENVKKIQAKIDKQEAGLKKLLDQINEVSIKLNIA